MLEILKQNGIEEAKANEIVKAMADAKVYTTSLENIDVRYNKLKDKVTQLEETNKNYEVQVKSLSKNNKDNAELMDQLEQLQLSNKELIEKHTKELYERDFNSALDKTLSDAKCKNNKALKALLDLQGINYQEGKLEGLETQIEKLKESDSYLFDLEVPPANTGSVGGFSRGGVNPVPAKKWKEMSLAEKATLFATDKEAYEQLKNN